MMVSRASPRLISSYKSFSRAASGAVIITGCLVLIGWFLNIPVLKSLLPRLPKMMSNTALLFILSGISLRLLHKIDPRSGNWKHLIPRLLAITITISSLFTLMEYIFNLDLGIDQILFKDMETPETSYPGRMSPHTAISFILSGIALLMIDMRKANISQITALFSSINALLSFIGYAYDIKPLYSISYHTGMSLITAIAFLFLSSGILSARAEHGLMEIFTGDSTGGFMARRLVPAAIVIPPVLGWLILYGQRRGLYDIEVGLFLFAISTILISIILILWNARLLERIDVERKHIGEELIASEKKYRTLVDNALVGVFVSTLKGEVLYVNKALVEIMEFDSQEEFISQGALARYKDPEDRKRLIEALKRSGSVKSFEFDAFTKTGKTRTVVISASLEGEILSVMVVDITERKKAEEEVLLLQETTQSLIEAEDFNHALETVLRKVCKTAGWVYGEAWVPSHDGSQLEISPAWCQCIEGLERFRKESEGYRFWPGNGVPGRAWSSKKPVWHEDATQNHIFLRAEIAGKSGLRGAVVGIPILSGDEVVAVMIFLLGELKKEDERLVGIISSVATQLGIAFQRKKAEDELKRYKEELEGKVRVRTKELEIAKDTAEAGSRAKSEFLANMSHELRTPLNTIMGFSEMMMEGMAGSITEQQREYLSDINDSGKHLLTLIDGILDLSRIEAGRMEPEISRFNLKSLIEESLLMFKEKSQRRNIQVKAEVGKEIGEIFADERMIKQILYNLLSNAFKFTPDGGAVTVRARKVDSEQYLVNSKKELFTNDYSLTTYRNFIEISVEDTGIGISPEDQKKLFQRFQQLETTLKKKYPGTGLGLNLCKKFIELHGGRIWVESEEGKGSKFSFAIPIIKDK